LPKVSFLELGRQRVLIEIDEQLRAMVWQTVEAFGAGRQELSVEIA